MRRVLAPALALSTVLSGAACQVSPATDEPLAVDDYELVPDGKADSYRSNTAQEFLARASATVTLDPALADKSDDERAAAARELVSARLLQIGWFLNLYVADKESEDVNQGYGGFHAMARNSSVAALEIVPQDALTYAFNFEATLAAENGFLAAVPGTAAAGGGKVIALKLGKLSNETLLGGAWQGRFDVHAWDPAKADPAAVETLPLTVTPAARSANAYLDHKALYADGKLTVGAQFGWDYNAGRQDLANAQQLYDDLLEIGFKSPVAKYEDLKLGSGPLTRTSLVGGKTVQVEVTLIHPSMVASAAANALELRNALLDLLATREVILFNGHAGVSGRLLPADFRSTSAGNILPAEYPTLKLLPGYQLLLIEGCQTYARFTDGFRQNPLKRGPAGQLVNMDIVTSTSYTWTSQGAESMEAILFPLVGRRATAPVKAVTWDDVLRALNRAPSTTAFMGVNGIDNDPHAHPYARPENLGKTCTATSQCGGEGNVCMRTGGTKKVCGTVCIDDAGCDGAAGYRCRLVASSGTLETRACAR